MMIRAAALLTLALSVLGALVDTTVTAADTEKDKTPSPRATQDIIVLGESRPVLIRLHVLIDGKPMEAAWLDFVGRLFKTLDRDGDGSLSKEEAEGVPSPQALLSAGGDTGRPISLRVLDADKDGKVSREELTKYYRQSGGGFQLQFAQPAGAMENSLNEMLFKKLDANSDGKLTRDELAQAVGSLLKLDLDEDEVVGAAELNPSLAQRDNVVVAEEAMNPQGAKPEATKVVFLANPDDSTQSWRHEMVTRYGAGSKKLKLKDKRLTREDLGLDQATFDRLDTEKDGELDREELARFTERPADIEITVRFGTRGSGEPQLELHPSKEATMQSAVRKLRDGLALDLGKTLAEMRCNDQGAIQAKINAQIARMSMLQQFKMLDVDNNGYLEKSEVERNPVFMSAFKAMDADNDEKVFEKEVIAYLDRTLEIQGRAQLARGMLTVGDQGKGLFDLIDANHDGRLTVREMRNAPAILENGDRDGDGAMASNEIPRSYQLNLSRDAAGGNRFGRRVVVVRAGGGPQAPAEIRSGPIWFQKMDRNRDGDISRREFLGTAEQFKQIDSDADGLISIQEAEKFDGEKRKK
jgi:Ca2+-binding EF-hand superfamily protein